MNTAEFLAVPIIAFMLSFTVAYILLSIFAFFRKILW